MEKKLLFFQNPNPRSSKTGYYLCLLAFIPPSNVIFPFWFVDKSALAYRSSSWTIPTISMQFYRYMLVLYQYNFTTVDFQASCTGTMCPLPLFKQVVPVHVYVVPASCWAPWCRMLRLREVGRNNQLMCCGFQAPHICIMSNQKVVQLLKGQ